MNAIILIVDDEKPTRDGLRLALDERFEVYVASDLREARQVLKSEPVDVLLTDLRLGPDSGMDLLDEALPSALGGQAREAQLWREGLDGQVRR